MVGGKPLHGLQHPELGHIRVARPDSEREAPGVCPFHGDCLEGLASGPAIKARWGAELGELPPDHPAWQLEADYLGQLCAQLVLMVSPQRIVLGGGVMGTEALFAPIRAVARARLGGYVPALERAGDFSQSYNSNGSLITIKDPATGKPYPGNKIPLSQINPLGRSILNFYPQFINLRWVVMTVVACVF